MAVWAFSAVLTILDYFPVGDPARTDVKLQVIYNAAWFRIPYPGKELPEKIKPQPTISNASCYCTIAGQWGWPTFSVSSILGMLAGVLAMTVESLGYYPTIAKMSGNITVYRTGDSVSTSTCS